ncbi:unnamed protein product [Heterobilharzia americana]|nr:unnamed protein product [Heterobilharzia americana]
MFAFTPSQSTLNNTNIINDPISVGCKPFKPTGLSNDMCSTHYTSQKSKDPLIVKHANHNNNTSNHKPLSSSLTSNVINSPESLANSFSLCLPSSPTCTSKPLFSYDDFERISPELSVKNKNTTVSSQQHISSNRIYSTPCGSNLTTVTIPAAATTTTPSITNTTRSDKSSIHNDHGHNQSIITISSATPTTTTTTTGNKRVHIKKPLNAFMLFMKDMRPKVQEECTLKESAAINQILGKKWHELSREKQAKYYELARKEKELHHQLFPGWSARDNYAIHSRRKKKRKLAAAAAAAAAAQSKTHSNNGKVFNKSGLHLSSESGGDFGNSDSNEERTGSGRLSLLAGNANSTDISSAKKCRARFGLEHQNRWCKPCRRKKKCIRFLTDAEFEEENTFPVSPISSPSTLSNSKKLTSSVTVTTTVMTTMSSTTYQPSNLSNYCVSKQFSSSSSESTYNFMSGLHLDSNNNNNNNGITGTTTTTLSSNFWPNYTPNIHHSILSSNGNISSENTSKSNNNTDGLISGSLLTYMSRGSHNVSDLTSAVTATTTPSTLVTVSNVSDFSKSNASLSRSDRFCVNSFTPAMYSNLPPISSEISSNWSYKNILNATVQNIGSKSSSDGLLPPSSSATSITTMKNTVLMRSNPFLHENITTWCCSPPAPPSSILSASHIPLPAHFSSPIHLPLSSSSEENFDVNYCLSPLLFSDLSSHAAKLLNSNHEKLKPNILDRHCNHDNYLHISPVCCSTNTTNNPLLKSSIGGDDDDDNNRNIISFNIKK